MSSLKLQWLKQGTKYVCDLNDAHSAATAAIEQVPIERVVFKEVRALLQQLCVFCQILLVMLYIEIMQPICLVLLSIECTTHHFPPPISQPICFFNLELS